MLILLRAAPAVPDAVIPALILPAVLIAAVIVGIALVQKEILLWFLILNWI